VLADKLFSSEQFITAAKHIGTEGQEEAVKKLSKSKLFMNFYKSLSKADKMSTPEQWITNAIQGVRQTTEGTEKEGE
jgi:hypothetical protein